MERSESDQKEAKEQEQEQEQEQVIRRERWLSTWNPANDPNRIDCLHAWEILSYCMCKSQALSLQPLKVIASSTVENGSRDLSNRTVGSM